MVLSVFERTKPFRVTFDLTKLVLFTRFYLCAENSTL